VPPGYTLARDFAPAAYPQPAEAPLVQVALVPAFRECLGPDTVHGPPLAFQACRGPAQASSHVTIGTVDANGKFSTSVGSAQLNTIRDDPSTPADESDVGISMSITDVRRRGDLAAYAGELEGRVSLRVTDRANGAANDAATVSDTSLHAALPCGPTGDSTQGSGCAVVTSADALVPGTVQDGRRAVWELGAIEVYDGGADGLASTTGDDQPFMRQGLFVP
jgi:hypothetical protein